MQTCIIFNPSARGGKAAAICARLEKLIPKAVWRRTGETGQACDLAAQAVRSGFPTIVAAGGDGTANEVANGIAAAPGGLESTHFGILPLGTINVFAREVGIPRHLPDAIRVLQEGKTTEIDLGCAEYNAEGETRRRFFIQLGGAGLDSRAIELVSWELKKKVGPVAYIVAGVKALSEVQPLIEVQGEESLSGELVLIGNGRFYGGSLAVFPRASLQDGVLDVCVLPKVSWFRLVPALLRLLTGRFGPSGSALHFRSHSVKLASAKRVILQLDGENICELPVTLTVRPKALKVIVP